MSASPVLALRHINFCIPTPHASSSLCPPVPMLHGVVWFPLLSISIMTSSHTSLPLQWSIKCGHFQYYTLEKKKKLISECLQIALKHLKTDFELTVILMTHLGCMDVAAFDTGSFSCHVLWVIWGSTEPIVPLEFFLSSLQRGTVNQKPIFQILFMKGSYLSNYL